MDRILFSTARIEVIEGLRPGLGTGFIVAHFKEERHAPFLVTGSQVVAGAVRGRVSFTAASDDRPQIDATITLEIDGFADIWHHHPAPEADVAVTPLAPLIATLRKSNREIFYTAIDEGTVPRLDVPNDIEAIEEVIFAGYPGGLYDPGRALPVIQRGLTATPFHVDYRSMPGFLVNAPVLPGTCGSPVISAAKAGAARSTSGHLLGILTRLAVMDDLGRVSIVPIPAAPVEGTVASTRISMGWALRSTLILEAIDGCLKVMESRPA